MKKITPNQKELEKQIKRIKRIVKRLEEEGYNISDDIIPKKPKRITKKYLEEVKKIKPKTLKQSFEFTEQKQDIKKKKKKTTKKNKVTKTVQKQTQQKNPKQTPLENNIANAPLVAVHNISDYVANQVATYTPPYAYYFLSHFESMVRYFGDEEIGKALLQMSENSIELTRQIIYASTLELAETRLHFFTSLIGEVLQFTQHDMDRLNEIIEESIYE